MMARIGAREVGQTANAAEERRRKTASVREREARNALRAAAHKDKGRV